MDCMALYKWIRWLYFHGLGGSATVEYSKPLYNEKLIKNQIILSSHLLDLSEDISKVAKKIYAVYEINLNVRRIVIPEISIGFVKQTV